MAYTEILENCVHSIGGVKDFYIATRDTNNDPLDFPMDVILKTGSTNTILMAMDYPNRIVTINNTQVVFRHVYPNFVSYNEEEVDERQGKYIRKTLEFSLPKVNPVTNSQLKEFLFTSAGEFAISNALVFFIDANNHNWISGFDIPFVLQNFDLSTDVRNADNQYTLKYIEKSYNRTFQYELI